MDDSFSHPRERQRAVSAFSFERLAKDWSLLAGVRTAAARRPDVTPSMIALMSYSIYEAVKNAT